LQIQERYGRFTRMSEQYSECEVCGKPIKGEWESQIAFGIETGELKDTAYSRYCIYDKHIRCSPSRAQRIVHPQFPPVIDERPKLDWRRDDGVWDDAMRVKYKKLYTDSWVRLQTRTNPTWQKEQRAIRFGNETTDEERSVLDAENEKKFEESLKEEDWGHQPS